MNIHANFLDHLAYTETKKKGAKTKHFSTQKNKNKKPETELSEPYF